MIMHIIFGAGSISSDEYLKKIKEQHTVLNQSKQ